MERFSKYFLSGFGSALSLYPGEVKRMPKLGLSQFTTHLTESAGARTIEAKKIHNAVSNMMRSSNYIDKCISRIYDSAGEGRPISQGSVVSHKRMKLVHDDTGKNNAFKPVSITSVYVDHAAGLNDMLNLRGDWQKVSKDLLVAKEIVTSEQ